MTDSDRIKQAIREELERLGFDPDQPGEAQQDAVWLRANRVRCQTVVGRLFVYLTLAVAGGTLALTWAGFKSKLGL